MAGKKWTPVHAAILGYQLAHSNRGQACYPDQKDLAEFCGVSVRTVQRYLDQLVGWGLIKTEPRRSLSRQTYRASQCTFLFALPDVSRLRSDSRKEARPTDAVPAVEYPVEKPVESVEKPVEDFRSRTTNPAEPYDTALSCPIRKSQKILSQQIKSGALTNAPCPEKFPGREPERREPERLSAVGYRLSASSDAHQSALPESRLFQNPEKRHSIQGRYTQGRYTQADYDERDWRKLNRELDLIAQASLGSFQPRGSPEDREGREWAVFRTACQRAGISVHRAQQLEQKMLA